MKMMAKTHRGISGLPEQIVPERAEPRNVTLT
jgi:hypothetical protein